MPIIISHSQLALPTLIILTLFLSACATTPAEVISPPSPETALELSNASADTNPVLGSTTATNVTLTADGGKVIDQTVFYNNPAGGDNVRFRINVDAQGTINEAEAEVLAQNPTSVRMQTSFAEALTDAVVGKNLADLEVDRVGGASLTTGAFNTFLATNNS